MPAPTVSVELAPEVIVTGLKVAVAPAGKPDSERLTVCGLPDVTAVAIVLVPDVPCTRLRLAGFADMEKSSTGGVETVRATVVVCVADVPVPVMTSV